MNIVMIALLLVVSPAMAGGHAADKHGKLINASVEELIAYAVRNNPGLQAMQYEIDAARDRIGPAGGLPDPSIKGELPLGSRRRDGESASLSGIAKGIQFSQTIPLWGKRELRRNIAETEVDQLQAQRAAELAALSARIKVAYAQRFFLWQSKTVNSEILTLLTTTEQIARERYAAGLGSQREVIDAQMQATLLRTELATQNAALRQADGKLNALLNRRVSEPLGEPRSPRVVPASAERNYVKLAQRLQATNPDLFSQDKRIKIADLRRQLIDKNRYPDLTVGASFMQIMIEIINIPLQRENRRAQEREAKIMVSAEQARKGALQNRLLGELIEHLGEVEAASAVENLGRTSALPQATLNFNASTSDYAAGDGAFNTALNAQIQIRKSELEQLKAKVDRQIHLAEIERLLGERL